MRCGWLRLACLLLCLPWLMIPSAAPARAKLSMTRAPQLGDLRLPWRIARGPDGAMWFTEQNADRIGRITPAGSVREYPIPTPRSGPQGITTCADGAVWFTEAFADQIGRLDLATGRMREYALPRLGSRPAEIVCGVGGDLWFADSYEQYIGRLDPRGGQVAEYPVYAARATDVTVASDGTAWVTYDNGVGSNIAHIDSRGHETWLQDSALPHGTALVHFGSNRLAVGGTL